MDNKGYFYKFSFSPMKLAEERLKVEREFKDKEKEIALLMSKVQLPKLLERIREITDEEFTEFAKSLRKMEVLLLIYEYPFAEESHQTKMKINRILLARYVAAVGRTTWELFQHDIEDTYLQELLRGAYNLDGFPFLEMEDRTKMLFDKTMSSSDTLISGIVTLLTHNNKKTPLALKQLKVKEDSPLEEVLLKEVLIKVLESDELIRRDGTEYVVGRLEKYDMNNYKFMLRVYLEPRSFDKFEYGILNQAIRRLHDPRERLADWEFLPEPTLDKVKKWLINNELKRFFEKDTNSQRFDYWKRFLNYMEDVKLLKDPFVAFIYFDRFVVVEYGNIGASYFYHKEGFNKIVYPETHSYKFRNRSTQTKESMLKIRESERFGIPLYINKLSHLGGWQRNFDVHMQRYLNSRY